MRDKKIQRHKHQLTKNIRKMNAAVNLMPEFKDRFTCREKGGEYMYDDKTGTYYDWFAGLEFYDKVSKNHVLIWHAVTDWNFRNGSKLWYHMNTFMNRNAKENYNA